MAVTVKPKAPEVNFEIAQGDTLEYAFSWSDKDGVALPLSAYTALMQLKLAKDSATSQVEITHLDNITLADTKPNIAFSIDATDIAGLTLSTPYFYDLQLTSAGGVVTTILQGTIIALQDTSR